MDQQRKHNLQSAGICHRLFCFFMKSLAAQAAKPVTLGSPVIHQQTRTPFKGRVDSESLVPIEIEDETLALLHNKGTGEGCCQDDRNFTGENGMMTRSKIPRKMVSIKDEPEIINHPNKKRRKNERQMLSMERGNEDVRPLRSILKVGSKLRESSVHNISPKHTRNSTLY